MASGPSQPSGIRAPAHSGTRAQGPHEDQGVEPGPPRPLPRSGGVRGAGEAVGRSKAGCVSALLVPRPGFLSPPALRPGDPSRHLFVKATLEQPSGAVRPPERPPRPRPPGGVPPRPVPADGRANPRPLLRCPSQDPLVSTLPGPFCLKSASHSVLALLCAQHSFYSPQSQGCAPRPSRDRRPCSAPEPPPTSALQTHTETAAPHGVRGTNKPTHVPGFRSQALMLFSPPGITCHLPGTQFLASNSAPLYQECL